MKQNDALTMILRLLSADERQCVTFLEQIPSDCVVTNNTLTFLVENQPNRSHDSVFLEKDPWLCDGLDLAEIPRFATISPKHIWMDNISIPQYTTYVSPRDKSSFKREVGVTIDTVMKCEQVSHLLKFILPGLLP